MSLNDWAYTPEEQDKLTKEDDLNEHIVIEGEIEGTVQQMKAMEVRFDDIKNIYQGLQEQGGMTRQVAQEARLVLPDFCNGAKDTEFTTVATHHNFKMALEELSLGMAAAVAAGFLAISALLGKFIGWLFGGSNSSGGGGGGGGGGGSRASETLAINEQSSKHNQALKRIEELFSSLRSQLTVKEEFRVDKLKNGKITDLNDLLAYAIDRKGDKSFKHKAEAEKLVTAYEKMKDAFPTVTNIKTTMMFKYIRNGESKDSVELLKKLTGTMEELIDLGKTLESFERADVEKLKEQYTKLQNIVENPDAAKGRDAVEVFNQGMKEAKNLPKEVLDKHYKEFSISTIIAVNQEFRVNSYHDHEKALQLVMDSEGTLKEVQGQVGKIGEKLEKLKADKIDPEDLKIMKDIQKTFREVVSLYTNYVSNTVLFLRRSGLTAKKELDFLLTAGRFINVICEEDEATRKMKDTLTAIQNDMGGMMADFKKKFGSS